MQKSTIREGHDGRTWISFGFDRHHKREREREEKKSNNYCYYFVLIVGVLFTCLDMLVGEGPYLSTHS